jgi:hypothetical protein
MTLVRKLLLSGLTLGLACTAVAAAAWSSFASTTANPSNSFSAGTVAVADNDAGASLLSLSSASPGAGSTGCIRVTYTGSLASSVRLYGSTTGPLAQYLNLTITRGTQAAPSFPSCSGFNPDPTNYIGAGAGVVYSGTLASFTGANHDFASGLADPGSWAQGDAHTYKLSVTLPSGAPAAAQGLSSTAALTWEAQNQ